MTKPLQLPGKRLREVHPAVDQINKFAASQLNTARQYELAIIATKRAIRVTPNSRELWSNIGTYYFNSRQYGEAEAAFARALVIDPDYAVAHCHLGLVYGATRHFDKAEHHYAEALRLDPDSLAIRYDRSMLKLRRGNYAEGFKEWEVRIPFKMGTSFPKYPFPYYAGEPLVGKTVYVCGEQGIGDTVLFSRFLPWISEQGCSKVYLHVNQQMTNLLWGYRHIVEFLPEGVPLPNADYAISMGSLPHWSGATLDNLPADPGKILWRVRQSAKDFTLPEPGGPNPFRVGIAWSGNPLMDRNEERSIPFHVISRVVENPRVWAHSFQCGPSANDIAAAGADQLVCDLSSQLMERGLVGCGAALLQMDLVITSCTSIAHLAGALGVPCWVMLCYDAYWPWLIDRVDSPWYPNTRLFRQTVPDNWVWVMNDVMKELDQLLIKKET